MTDPLPVDHSASTAAVLERLTRPYDRARALCALLGCTMTSARQILGVSLATSPEAHRLLDAMPQILRSLAIASTDNPTRCHGELRGPVLWAETVSARAASAGDPGLYVCSTTTKAYDTRENRVLKAALAAVGRAGRDAEAGHVSSVEDLVPHARHNGQRASHLLEHQTLSGVTLRRLSTRDLSRTRAGSRRGTYAPAMAVLHRARAPLEPDLVASFADDATRRTHRLLDMVLQGIDELAGTSTRLHTSRAALVAGPVRFEHPRGRADAVPTLSLTVAGIPVNDPQDVPLAVDAARAALSRRA